MSKSVSVQGGPGIAGLLGVAFIVLKLTKVIDWSWWWVTSPFWIPAAALAAGALVVALFYVIYKLATK